MTGSETPDHPRRRRLLLLVPLLAYLAITIAVAVYARSRPDVYEVTAVLRDDSHVGRGGRVRLSLLTAALAWLALNAPNFALDASADALLLENDRDLKIYRDSQTRYRTQDLLFVTFAPKYGIDFTQARSFNLAISPPN